jgi:anti-sigma regulatory factor (Ser/Thr protein kinase)
VEAVSTCLPTADDVAWLNVDEPAEVGRVRRVATHLAERLAFPGDRVAEIALAVTEIGTNLHKHAGGGQVVVRSVRTAEHAAVEVVAIDRGPGIADVGLAMTDGQSTTGTLGLGLGAVARSADGFSLASDRGRGTVLVARFLSHRTGVEFADDGTAAGLTRAMGSEDVCGDAYAVRRAPGRLTLMMCDGSGHGPLAASASREAVRAFCDLPPGPPEETVARSRWPTWTSRRARSGSAVWATSRPPSSPPAASAAWCRCPAWPGSRRAPSAPSTTNCPPGRRSCCTPTA